MSSELSSSVDEKDFITRGEFDTCQSWANLTLIGPIQLNFFVRHSKRKPVLLIYDLHNSFPYLSFGSTPLQVSSSLNYEDELDDHE